MTKEELIAQCRYYRGEEKNPFEKEGIMGWYWDMERVYVQHGGKIDGEKEYYERIGGKKYPGIPYDLLITMFTSWGKCTYDIKNSIQDFYKDIDYYLLSQSKHFPEDKIPNKTRG